MPPRPSTEKPIDRFRFDGRTVVVTGGASGLGQTFAESLADAGAHVAAEYSKKLDQAVSTGSWSECRPRSQRRVGDKKEIAELVLYLASDASTYLSGQVIARDDGIGAA